MNSTVNLGMRPFTNLATGSAMLGMRPFTNLAAGSARLGMRPFTNLATGSAMLGMRPFTNLATGSAMLGMRPFTNLATSSSKRGTRTFVHPATGTGRRVVVGMSGGVDSSVSAALLKEQGYDVCGLFMRNWDFGDEFGDTFSCPASQDYEDVRKVCHHLDIECRTVDFVKEYWNEVFEPYVERFSRGTPNPDVFCNREIKFNSFRKYAMQNLQADFVATGHYVQVNTDEELPHLLKGFDKAKDQSYFLSAVPGSSFSNAIFPIGGMEKWKVRELAHKLHLPTASRKESMGICFVGKRDFGDFISKYVEDQPGHFVNANGEVIASHKGLHRYTIGQGAKIAGLSTPLFVARKNFSDGTITVVPDQDPLLLRSALVVKASEMFWVAESPPSNLEDIVFECKYRYVQDTTKCKVKLVRDSTSNEVTQYELKFVNPQRAVTEQQVVALYVGERCFGGGIIHETFC